MDIKQNTQYYCDPAKWSKLIVFNELNNNNNKRTTAPVISLQAHLQKHK